MRAKATEHTLDCLTCGACCRNPAANRDEAFHDWVEVERGAALLRRATLARQLVITGADGRPHLRLQPDGRCVALRGTIAERVQCSIYALRPKACRRVEAGSSRCLQYRAEQAVGEPRSALDRPRA